MFAPNKDINTNKKSLLFDNFTNHQGNPSYFKPLNTNQQSLFNQDQKPLFSGLTGLNNQQKQGELFGISQADKKKQDQNIFSPLNQNANNANVNIFQLNDIQQQQLQQQKQQQQGLNYQQQSLLNTDQLVQQIKQMENRIVELETELKNKADQEQRIIQLENNLKILASLCQQNFKGSCNNGHTLEYCNGLLVQSFYCDVCKQRIQDIGDGMGTYRCITCDFDRCEKCYNQSRLV